MDAFSVGGTIRTTFNTAAALSERHDVEVVSVYRRRETPALPLAASVRLRVLSDQRRRERSRLQEWAMSRPSRIIHPQDVRHAKFNGLTDVQLLRFLRSVDDGILVGTRPGLNLAIARHGRRTPVRVGQDHMNLRSYKPELRDAIARHYGKLDMVTTLTDGSAGDYRKLLGNAVRIEAVPNAAVNAALHHSPLDAAIVVSAGRLIGRKGFDRLLRVWRRVVGAHPGWRLRIFGRGPDRPALVRLAAELGIGDSVDFAGQTAQLGAELAAASVYAMASRREGMPMVLLEAMAAGLPVVAYDCPTGPRELIDDGVNGYLVRDGDEEAMARALGTLIADEALRRACGAAALATAGRYQLSAIGARWEGLLQELSAAVPPSGSRRL